MKKIFIAYEELAEREGSVQLRGFQVFDALSKLNTLPHVEIIGVSRLIKENPKNEIILCVKPQHYELYKKIDSSNFIIFDILDTIGLVEPADLNHISAAIFCSNKIRSRFSQKFKYPDLCKTIYHHWDTRISLSPVEQETFSIGYFGERWKARIYPGIGRDISLYYADYLDKLNHHNCHYILRPDNHIRNFEPLTKISSAALVGAVVISDADHSTELLGYNYPYYVNASIPDMFRKVRNSFGSSEWNFARQIMSDIKERTSLSSTIKEYENLFKEIL